MAPKDEDDDGQKIMFPELDTDKPEHKAVLAAAKRFYKQKQERDELLSTAKQKQDADEAKLIELMHGAKLTKFRYKTYEVEVVSTREKAIVKMKPEKETKPDPEDSSNDDE